MPTSLENEFGKQKQVISHHIISPIFVLKHPRTLHNFSVLLPDSPLLTTSAEIFHLAFAAQILLWSAYISPVLPLTQPIAALFSQISDLQQLIVLIFVCCQFLFLSFLSFYSLTQCFSSLFNTVFLAFPRDSSSF